MKDKSKSLLIGVMVILAIHTNANPLADINTEPEKKTFMFIHGSWHSSWNWYKVKPSLEKMGHTVIAPDLPALGRDMTPVEEVRFDKTVEILCKMIDSVGGKVILVGHSKNGVLISQMAENRPHKIEKLVYLAAVLAKDGKSALDYFKLDKGEVLGPHITYDSIKKASFLLPRIYKEGLYHDCDDEITEMAKILLRKEPRQTAITPISITEGNWGSVPRYYIECTEDKAITPQLQQMMYKEIPCDKVYKMDTSHSPFFSQPKELIDILIDISKS